MKKIPEFTLAYWLGVSFRKTAGWTIAAVGLAIGFLPLHRWLVAAIILAVYVLLAFGYALWLLRVVKRRLVVVKAFPNWGENEVKARYTVQKLMERVRDQDRIAIAARTCFRWLCGSEQDYVNDNARYRLAKVELHNAIVNTFSQKKRFMLTLVLQCPSTEMSWWPKSSLEVTKNKDHFRIALESFSEIRESLGPDKDRLALFVTNVPIPNSMTRVLSPQVPVKSPVDRGSEPQVSMAITNTRRMRVVLMIVDLSDPFFLTADMTEDTRLSLRKPFVVFETDKGDIEEYRTATETLFEQPALCDECSDSDCPAKQIKLLHPDHCRSAVGL